MLRFRVGVIVMGSVSVGVMVRDSFRISFRVSVSG